MLPPPVRPRPLSSGLDSLFAAGEPMPAPTLDGGPDKVGSVSGETPPWSPLPPGRPAPTLDGGPVLAGPPSPYDTGVMTAPPTSVEGRAPGYREPAIVGDPTSQGVMTPPPGAGRPISRPPMPQQGIDHLTRLAGESPIRRPRRPAPGAPAPGAPISGLASLAAVGNGGKYY